MAEVLQLVAIESICVRFLFFCRPRAAKFSANLIHSSIETDNDIISYSKNLDINSMQEKITHKTNSFFKRENNKGKKTWSANIKSNADWQKSWENNQKSLKD